MLLGSKEHCGGKNSLETFDEAPISLAVFEQAEKVEHFGRGLETDDPALLANGERGNPNGDEAVLAVGDGRFIMHLPQ